MSCMWKLSLRSPPEPKKAESGSVLDNLRCVGHSAFQPRGDAKDDPSGEGNKQQRAGGQVAVSCFSFYKQL